MSGVAVIRYLLANDAAVTAQVPAARIFGGPIPLNTALPAIGVEKISGTQLQTVAMSESPRLRTDRVQVTVHAGTYPAKETIVSLVRAACGNRHATVNAIAVDSILDAGEGPDFDDPGAFIYERSLDFMVRFSATA